VILLCYDGSPDSEAAVGVAAQLFPSAPVTVLTVWEPFVELLARTGGGMTRTGYLDIAAIDADAKENARTRAQEGVERAKSAGLDAQPATKPAPTSVAEAILCEARQIDAEAIIVGTRGLRGLKSLLLGSVSHAVVQHADRPVLVVPSPAADRQRAG
jgi:nucleotide-binding universal stress UspA family protein